MGTIDPASEYARLRHACRDLYPLLNGARAVMTPAEYRLWCDVLVHEVSAEVRELWERNGWTL